MTFDIHPTELFAPQQSPPYIASLSQRVELMEQHGGGVEAVAVVRFDRDFAGLSPEAFVAGVLYTTHAAHEVRVA